MAKHRRRLRAVMERLLLLAASTALALTAAEGMVRWLAPQQLILMRPDVWVPDTEGLGWRMAANVDTWINTGERDVHLVTDEHGYRIGTEPPAGPPDHRILALGDSFLAAVEVAYEDTFAARLEASLSRATGTRVQVINTGVAGWDPNHYLIKARRELVRRHYDLVLVFLFRGNDAMAQRQDVFAPKQGEVVHHFRRPHALTAREIQKAWLYPVNDFLERRSHLFVMARRQAWYLLMRMGLSGRRFPTAELRSEAQSARWEVTGELCSDIAAAAGEYGVETLFVLLPGAYHVEPALGLAYARAVGLGPDDVDLGQTSRLLGAELARRGLRFLDLSAPLAALRAAGVATHGQVDTHLAPDGHAAVARELQEPVLRLLTSAPRRPPAALPPREAQHGLF